MSKWLEAETAGFNRTFARRQAGTPLVEFLTVAARRAAGIYGRALHDVTAQVPILPPCSAAAERRRPLHALADMSKFSMYLHRRGALVLTAPGLVQGKFCSHTCFSN